MKPRKDKTVRAECCESGMEYFGDSYRYRQKYKEFKKMKQEDKNIEGQMSFEDYPGVIP